MHLSLRSCAGSFLTYLSIFSVRGIGYGAIGGLALGAAFGTLIIPLLGTIFGGLIGLSIGLLVSLPISLIISTVTWWLFVPLHNRVRYQQMVQCIGLLTALVSTGTLFYLILPYADPIGLMFFVILPTLLAVVLTGWILEREVRWYVDKWSMHHAPAIPVLGLARYWQTRPQWVFALWMLLYLGLLLLLAGVAIALIPRGGLSIHIR